ncbi:MAG: hypothetical protein GY705_10885 [Bacteroidetes bacterium]|nr:hypothetical protein [Bacteroidota bacterium]
MKNSRYFELIFLLSILLGFSQCYSAKWVDNSKEKIWNTPSVEIVDIFQKYPNSVMTIEAKSPGYDYDFDIAEKDNLYGEGQDIFRFEKVEIKLRDKMPEGMMLVDIDFLDRIGTIISVKELDLMRLIPSYETRGDLQYSELLLEEFNRFGVVFRKEHGEFEIETDVDAPEVRKAIERTYRMSITNNCLEPTKWEMALTTEDYSDFGKRLRGEVNINQKKLLSHSWFFLDSELYNALIKLKNPQVDIDLNMSYDSATVIAENTVVDFESLRYPLEMKLETEALEFGHQSGRKLEPLDIEEHYKWKFGLLLNKEEFPTYASILEKPVKIARFSSRGFYNPETPNVYDYGFLKHIDNVVIENLSMHDSDCYVQIKLTGQYAPFEIVIGNVDLALFDEQKLTGFLFGYNTYPKSRRYNPKQNTLFYDPDSYPDLLKPYILMIDKKSGKWINNQMKGVEKVYISYETLERDVLQIHLLSYERVTPLWMARIKLPKKTREAVRVRKLLYSY